MSPAAQAAARFRFAPVLTATVLTVLLLWLFGKAAPIFLLLFGAILISLFLGAVAEFFVARLRFSRRASLFLSIILSLAGIVGLFWLLIPPVVEQTQALVQVMPTYISGWETKIEQQVARLPGLAQFWKPGEHRVLLAVYEQL